MTKTPSASTVLEAFIANVATDFSVMEQVVAKVNVLTNIVLSMSVVFRRIPMSASAKRDSIAIIPAHALI